jgi:hypothetical protein
MCHIQDTPPPQLPASDGRPGCAIRASDLDLLGPLTACYTPGSSRNNVNDRTRGRVRARQFAFAIGVSSSSLSRSERLWHQRVAPNPVHPSVYDEAKIDISS